MAYKRAALARHYIPVLWRKYIRLGKYLSKAMTVFACVGALWVVFDAFWPNDINFGLGEWTVKRPLDKQACVHPEMPVNNPNIMQYLRKVPPIQCTDEDWVFTKNGRVYISQAAEDRHGPISCEMTYIYMDGNDEISARSNTEMLKDGSLLEHDSFSVKCKAEDGQSNENLHSGIARRNDILVKTKPQTYKHSNDKATSDLNIVIWGLDSMSSLMFQRVLPKAHRYFTETLGGVLLEGYNIAGDGTPQNWIPILTGKKEFDMPDVRKGEKGSQFVDVYPFIWKEYAERGYVTHHAEEDPPFGMWNYRLNGFKTQPTHHYWRPFYLEAPKYMSAFYLPFDNRPSKFCIGSRPRPRLMFDWIKESFETYKDMPKFFAFFNSELTHEYNNLGQLFEPYLLEFFEFMNSKGHLDNTILIIMSDHGARFNKLRATEQGKLEERMPYFGFRFPEWFQKVYEKEYKAFLENSYRLTTPFDIHETLVDLLYDFPANNNKTYGQSLFKPIPLERTCAEAQIEPHACLSWERVSSDSSDALVAVNSVINIINTNLKPFETDCEMLTLARIKDASKFSTNKDVLRFRQTADAEGYAPDLGDNMQALDVLFLVTFYTEPKLGLFEATVRKRALDGQFEADIKQISRLNKYGNDSWCLKEKAARLLLYCVCKTSKV